MIDDTNLDAERKRRLLAPAVEEKPAMPARIRARKINARSF